MLLGLLAGASLTCSTDDDGADEATETQDGPSEAEVMACLDSAKPVDTPISAMPMMNTWGSACTTHADCEARLGPGAICESQSVIYELPGNYCTKPCTLPDTTTTIVPNDPVCDPAGGVHCVGQKYIYERCIPPCTENGQCNRYGYLCRQMPSISQPTDPSFCLMPDCCLGECGSAAAIQGDM